MFLIKQSKQIRNFATALNQIKDLNRSLDNTICINRTLSSKITSNSDYKVNALRTSTPNVTAIRHHYRNTDYHPSKIVRAYRMTRTWLTDHFIIADNRIENIYSFSMLVTTAILLLLACWLNLQEGGEAGGYDVNRIKATDSNTK